MPVIIIADVENNEKPMEHYDFDDIVSTIPESPSAASHQRLSPRMTLEPEFDEDDDLQKVLPVSSFHMKARVTSVNFEVRAAAKKVS